MSADRDDFTEWVEARGPSLWRAAWLLTGDGTLAEDLVQTALAKCWRHYGRVAAEGSFEAYVRRAMVTTYASWRGRRWRGEIPTAELPERSTSQDLGNPDVLRALARLSPRQRAVVVLRYFEDLTEAQVAASLDCSVGTVKTHHARALAQLRGSELLATDDIKESR